MELKVFFVAPFIWFEDCGEMSEVSCDCLKFCPPDRFRPDC